LVMQQRSSPLPARIRTRIVLLAGLCLGAYGVSAETLEEAWALALQNDRSLASVRSQAEAADLEVDAARAQRWPTLAVDGRYTWLNESPAFDFSWTGLPITPPKIFADDRFGMGSATLQVPVYTGGRISSGIAAAEARSRGADAQALSALQNVRLAVAESYVNVLRARRALAVAESNVASLRALSSDVGNLFERDLVPKNELLAVQVALSDAEQGKLRASNAVEIAVATYNRWLGEPLDRPVSLSDTLPAPEPLPTELDALVLDALARRSELTVLKEQSQAYEELANTERARSLPQVSIGGAYNYIENQALDEEQFYSAGVGVQWALFSGGQIRKRAAALERSRRATEEMQADMESVVALEVRQAWLAVDESRQRVDVTANAAAQAEENLRMARERYGVGLGTQTQLLQAETLRVQALTNRDNAVLDAELARLRLARAVGSL
jgi:outer membrane protein